LALVLSEALAGVVVHGGDESYLLDDRIVAVPWWRVMQRSRVPDVVAIRELARPERFELPTTWFVVEGHELVD
jgi:hypothetical protein